MVAHFCEYTKSHRTVYFTQVTRMEWELYLNKAIPQKDRRETGEEGGRESARGDRASPPTPTPGGPSGRVLSVSESKLQPQGLI